MATVALTLEEIYALAHDTMTANGCNDENASALADIVMRAIKGWAQQFGHGGINNHEVFGLALLGTDDARD